jgi:ribonucleoside-triphosphate reductase
LRIHQTYGEEFDNFYNEYGRSQTGKQLIEIEGIARKHLDIGAMSKAYFTERISDMSIDQNANANESPSVNNYSAEITKGILKLEGYYLIWYYSKKRFGIERANEMIKAIWDGDLYFHDASGPQIQINYCWAYSTNIIMLEGRPYGQLQSIPPKRADSFMSQAIETTMDICQEFAGAIAPSDLIINYAWYAKKENLSDHTIVNDLQKFVHVMNNKFRTSGQSPFVNLSLFDRPNLEKVFEHYTYPDGTKVDVEYVMHVQKIFGEWFSLGDPVSKLPYRFPIVTLNISKDKFGNIIDTDFLDWSSKININTGCFNIYVNDGTKIASCCRLLNDMSRMQYKSDTFGNGGMNIGSHRVVTINLPRIALKAEGDTNKFDSALESTLSIARDLLLVHREEIIKRRIEQGFLKFFSPMKWFSMNHMFSTIGIIGVYEANYLMDLDIKTSNGIEFTEHMLRFIEDFAQKSSEDNKCSFNVEEIPGESVAARFCLKDKIIFGSDIVPFELYSNQYIPLIDDALLPERISITGKFMDILSGGGIMHINIKEKIIDAAVMKKLIEYSVQHGVSHLAINYGFGVCKNNHTTICGNSTICPVCGEQITDWFTRIIGYFTKVSSWNKVRREYEFKNRTFNGIEMSES